jgi:hypothetical protein
MGKLFFIEPSAARSGLIFIVPCVLIMTYWQITSDGRWNRLNITNIVYTSNHVLRTVRKKRIIEKRRSNLVIRCEHKGGALARDGSEGR